MQTTLTFVAILTMAMLLLCRTRPAFILLTVLAVVSAVCCIVVSYILRKRTDEKNTKDAVLQKKIANWRKVRRRQLRNNADSNGMFDACGVTQDLRLSLEEDEQFFEENHKIEELETQISLTGIYSTESTFTLQILRLPAFCGGRRMKMLKH